MMSMIGPLPDLVKEKAANYKAISNEEYIRLVVTSKLDGKHLLDHMKLKQWETQGNNIYKNIHLLICLSEILTFVTIELKNLNKDKN